MNCGGYPYQPAAEMIGIRQPPFVTTDTLLASESSAGATLPRAVGKPRRSLVTAATSAVLLASAFQALNHSLQYPVAVGIDGYYYVLQVDHLLGSGHLYYPSNTPLIIYLLAGVRCLIGDTALAIKIGSCLLHLFLCLGIFKVVEVSTHKARLGTIGAALLASSGQHLYLVTEFVNNLGAVSLIVWSVWCAIRAGQARSVASATAAAALLLAASFCHRSALPLAVALAASAFLAHLFIKGAASNKHRWLTLSIAILAYAAPALISLQPFVAIPVWLAKELTATPAWPLDETTIAEGLILLLASPAVLFLTYRSGRSEGACIAVTPVASVALFSLLFTLNPFIDAGQGIFGIAGRMRGLAYVQVAIIVPGLFGMLLPRWRAAVAYSAACILPLVLLSASSQLPFGLRPDYLVGRMRMIRTLSTAHLPLKRPGIIVAPHGEQFIISSTLGVNSQHNEPHGELRQDVWWLVHGLKPQMTPGTAVILGEEDKGTYLAVICDMDLRRLLNGLTNGERQSMLEANPHLRKPSHSAS